MDHGMDDMHLLTLIHHDIASSCAVIPHDHTMLHPAPQMERLQVAWIRAMLKQPYFTFLWTAKYTAVLAVGTMIRNDPQWFIGTLMKVGWAWRTASTTKRCTPPEKNVTAARLSTGTSTCFRLLEGGIDFFLYKNGACYWYIPFVAVWQIINI